MGKYCKGIVLAICFMFATSAYAVSPVILHGMSGGSYCDTSSTVFWWRAEAADFSGTNGTLDYSAGDDTGTLASSAAINTDASYFGSGNGLDIPTGSDSISFDTSSTTLDDEGRFEVWLYVTTWVDNASIFNVRDDDNNYFELQLDYSDEIEFNWVDSSNTRLACVSSGANISTGGWVFVQVSWNASTDVREIYVDGTRYGSGGNCDTTINSFAGAVATHRFGNIRLAASDFYMDNIIVSTDSTIDPLTTCKDEEQWPE